MYKIRTLKDLELANLELGKMEKTRLKKLIGILETEYDGNLTPEYGGVILISEKSGWEEAFDEAMKLYAQLKDMPYEWKTTYGKMNLELYMATDDFGIIVGNLINERG